MSILLINGSPNKEGNTAALAAKLLRGRKLYFVFQGAAPETWMLEAGEYTMRRFAGLYGMTYCGMVTNAAEATKRNEEM